MQVVPTSQDGYNQYAYKLISTFIDKVDSVAQLEGGHYVFQYFQPCYH